MKDRMWGTPKSRDTKKESDRRENTPENLELKLEEQQLPREVRPVPLVVRSHTFWREAGEERCQL